MAERFSIEFKGPGVEDQTIDAGMLASSLLALTELIEEAQETVDPDGPRYRVNVTSLNAGSFGVTLEMQEWLLAATAFFASGDMNAAAVLKTLFGGPGLFELLRFLGGKKPKRMEQVGDALVVEVDDRHREFSLGAGKLFMKRSARRSVRKFVQPLGSEDITSLSVDVPDQETLLLRGDDQSALAAPMSDETVTDNTVEMWLNVDTIRFESKRWTFRDPHTKQVIRATILDEPFLARVAQRQESFSKGDSLYCRVHIQQWETGDGTLETEYSIVEVVSHGDSPGTQGALPT